MTSDQWVLNTIQHGYRLEFTGSPPVTRSIRQTKIPADPQKHHVLRQEVQQLSKHAIQRVGPDRRGFHLNVPPHQEERRVAPNSQPSPAQPVHPSEAVPHGNSRGIHTRTTQRLVGASLDLKDAYLHVPIHSSDGRWLGRFLPGDQVLIPFQQPALSSVDCSQDVYQNCLRIPG